MSAAFTQRYTVHHSVGGYQFTFFCDLCNHSFNTVGVSAPTLEDALALGQVEARQHFNMCHRCGRWICDEHYNEDDMQCTACTPRQGPPPAAAPAEKICPHCGGGNKAGNRFCQRCGKTI